MAVTRTVRRNQAMGGAPPSDVLRRANHILASENDRTMFVTLFLAHYETQSGRLTYANAGHNPPCVVAADGTVRALGASTGPVLGVFRDEALAAYAQGEVGIAPRDSIVLYTDGVTEAMDPAGRQFRLDRLERIVAHNAGASPEELCRLVIDSVEAHRQQVRQDDLTLLVLRRNQ
jgi:sigma-B regulation protein RsbU (phosphoserine phosphatase)